MIKFIPEIVLTRTNLKGFTESCALGWNGEAWVITDNPTAFETLEDARDELPLTWSDLTAAIGDFIGKPTVYVSKEKDIFDEDGDYHDTQTETVFKQEIIEHA